MQVVMQSKASKIIVSKNDRMIIIYGYYYQRGFIVTKEEIIKNLKNSNSVGWNNIPTNILKTNVMTLAPILSNLINKSLAQGLFPVTQKS